MKILSFPFISAIPYSLRIISYISFSLCFPLLPPLVFVFFLRFFPFSLFFHQWCNEGFIDQLISNLFSDLFLTESYFSLPTFRSPRRRFTQWSLTIFFLLPLRYPFQGWLACGLRTYLLKFRKLNPS
ncbi:hypothetical protein B9Z19DRAFT_229817 [Tuber borchii]|uniref:Uncharacterized protein n=1 Tax=Tuber borchii TaxID=42251 RepID=A0A2T6ZMT8_TUBBO|nr:hypothetical protein B9Z19DRAFT_229817 [Tuber borchii]